jgi:hypothetical protein
MKIMFKNWNNKRSFEKRLRVRSINETMVVLVVTNQKESELMEPRQVVIQKKNKVDRQK